MSRPPIQSFQSFKLTADLTLSECHPDSERQFVNWWLWDRRARINVVMGAKTREEALVRAIDHWARRAIESEQELAELRARVDSFVEAVRPSEPKDDND